MAFTGYNLDGVTLHEGHGVGQWRTLREGTNTQGGIVNNLTKVPSPLKDGYIPAPYSFQEQIVVFTVRTPRSRLEELLALCAEATLLRRNDDATKYAHIQLVSAIPNGNEPLDGFFDVTITLNLYQGVWRDVSATVYGAYNVNFPVTVWTFMDNISAPVNDMAVWIGGTFTSFTLTDSAGSWLKTIKPVPGGPLPSQGVLFHGYTGRAFISQESDPLTPLYDASDLVDVSGGRGFQMTPSLVNGNPKTRRASLTLSVQNWGGVRIIVRGKTNYRMN